MYNPLNDEFRVTLFVTVSLGPGVLHERRSLICQYLVYRPIVGD